MKVAPAVDASVGSLLLIGWSGSDQTESPPLELIGVLLRQSGSIREASRFADDFKSAILAEGIPQAVADEGNR